MDERALTRADEDFHTVYDDACAQAETDPPVLVVLADSLLVFRGKSRSERRFSREEFHRIKEVAHAPVAAFVVLRGCAGQPLTEGARAHLVFLQSSLAKATVAGIVTGAADVETTRQATLDLVTTVLAQGTVDDEELLSFAARIGPLLLRLTEHATRVQLSSLHAAVEAELSSLTEAEVRLLQVVVTGDHQARRRSLGMQYFQKRLGEPPDAERQVTYGEGIETPEEALSLVGKRRVDRAIAGAFFGDEKRLQRDVLGDATKSLLDTFSFAS